MIKNESQYNITKSYLEKFRLAALALEEKESTLLLELEKKSIQSQMLDLQREIDEYNDLKSGFAPVSELQFIDELPKTLIKSRISLGLDQKKLGKLVGLQEQQIQQYESTDYEAATVAKVREIARALDFEMEKNTHFYVEDFSKNQFFKKMEEMGLDREFVVNCLLPASLSAYFADPGVSSQLLEYQAATHVSRIFGVSSSKIFNPEPLVLNINSLALVHFKSSKNVNVVKRNAYAVYARYTSLLVSKATLHIALKKISDNPFEIRGEILAKYGEINFKTLLDYIWNLGIPVLTLDSIPFHAACFCDKEKSVITLAPKISSEIHWMYVLLYELYHALHETEQIVESNDELHGTDKEQLRGTGEESLASQFAGIVLLGLDPRDLATLCLERSNRDIDGLIPQIEKIVKEKGIRADILAYYISFRISSHDRPNWWMTVDSFQGYEIVQNILQKKIDFNALTETDHGLLKRATAI